MCPYCDALTYSFWLNWSILLLSYIWLLICAWEIVNKLRKSVFYNHLWERYFNPPFLLGGGYFKTVRTVLYPNENGTLSSWERYFTDFLLRFERGTKSMVYLIKYNDLFHILLFHVLYTYFRLWYCGAYSDITYSITFHCIYVMIHAVFRQLTRIKK